MRNEKEIREIAAFLKKMYFPAKKWPWEALLKWLRWYDEASGLLVSREFKRIKAVALMRAVSKPEDGFKEYCFDESGKIVWVQAIASQHPIGIKTLWKQMELRFPNFTEIAFSREKNGSELKTYDREKMFKKL